MVVLVIVLSILVGYASWGYVVPKKILVLTVDDLPLGVMRIEHHHPVQYTDDGEVRPEMEHWATPSGAAAGGPVYGVYAHRIVAIEYEIPESKITERPVGDKDDGMELRDDFLGFTKPSRYDHVHIGRHDESLVIHYMFISHEEETKIGLSCS